jgi:hypothetical protein
MNFERPNLIQCVESTGVELKQHAGEYRCRCPIHHGENDNAFVIYDNGKKWKCYTGDCNERVKGNDSMAFLMALGNKTFKEVLADLGQLPEPETPEQKRLRELERAVKELQRKQVETEKRVKTLEDWRKEKTWDKYHSQLDAAARELWRAQGIPDEIQNYYKLGYEGAFFYTSKDEHYYSPTLTIPIFEPDCVGDEVCLTVRHRLLTPAHPGDKYRPDYPGLGSHPFYANLETPLRAAERVLIVEGEKKAIISNMILKSADTQVIGIPGKTNWHELAPQLLGKPVWICLDPDAQKDAAQMAHEIGGARLIALPDKIDDMILTHQLTGDWLESVMTVARLVK